VARIFAARCTHTRVAILKSGINGVNLGGAKPPSNLKKVFRSLSSFLQKWNILLVNFHVDVVCNTNASDVCKIKFTYLLTYLFIYLLHF